MPQIIATHADAISLFIIALSAAFSHCFAMCGGIVIACTQAQSGGFWRKIASHALYNLGRICTYVAIGVLCAYLGARFAIGDSARGGIFVLVGFGMILFGVGYLALPKLLFFLEPNIGNFSLLKKAFNAILRRKSVIGAYFLGVLNGAIPCGIVYFFALNAAISGSLINGAKTMLIFGVASAIPMLLLGIFSAILLVSRLKSVIMRLSSLMIIAFGAWTIFKGFKILFAGV